MELYHWSKIILDPKRLKLTEQQTIREKPKGLWVSVGEEWKDWCENNDYEIKRLKYKHKVSLARKAKILLLDTPKKVIDFTKKYKYIQESPSWASIYNIDWIRISQSYQGIIIAPYQWSLRLDNFTSWYYTWDIASGCIWDNNAIADIRLEI